MNLEIAGKNCLITGGSSGIGLGIAKVLAREGVNLAIASRNPDPETIEELKSYGTKVLIDIWHLAYYALDCWS